MSSKKYGSKFLKGFRNYRVASGVTALAIESYLQALDCPRSLTVWLLFSSGEHTQLAELGFNPTDYNSVDSVRSAYAATKLLSKFKGLTLDSDLDKVALDKFKKFELLCKQTNSRFRNLSSDPQYKGPIVYIHHACIRKIERLLGEFDSEEFLSKPDWGPGASTLIKRRDASSARKFQNETGITRDLYSLLPFQLMQKIYPAWAERLLDSGYPDFQLGNRVVTVPKDASANRVIAIEPGINLWFQLSIFDMIRSRLLRAGIDLRMQKTNQLLALSGSLTGEYATVDLSSASDSISSAVVEELLPPRWFLVLNACRTRFGYLEGLKLEWQKFSSMGNGFTFALQSLIFFAIAKSCVEYLKLDGKVSVYGDDVVLPTKAFKLFSECLEFYGFRLNEKKSHYNSPFRESCGAHYYSGFDVKPIYLKDKLTTVQTVFRFANAVRRLAHRSCANMACDAKFRPTFDLLFHLVPKALRLRIPNDLGDGGFISNFDEATPSRARHGIEGYYVYNSAEVSVTHQMVEVGYLLAELWRISDRECCICPFSNLPGRLKAISCLTCADVKIPGRNSVPLHQVTVKIAKSLVRWWYSLGPWV